MEDLPAPKRSPVQFSLKGLLFIQLLAALAIGLAIYDADLGILAAIVLGLLGIGYALHTVNFHGVLIVLILVGVLTLSIRVNQAPKYQVHRGQNGIPDKDGLNFTTDKNER